MPIMRADDADALEKFGGLYWLDSLQPLRGYEALPQDLVDRLRSNVVTHVDVVEIVAAREHGCSYDKATILTMPCPGSIDGATLLQAVWCGYMLSLKATMDAGHERAHVGDEPDAIELATDMVGSIGATATPSDEVYGSGGTYLEDLCFRYEPGTRTLSVEPIIGS